MTREDKMKLIELTLDYEKKSYELDRVIQEHKDYMVSNDYKHGSNESVELANKEVSANLAWISAAESVAKFVSEKLEEID
jgi:hypothetical protein